LVLVAGIIWSLNVSFITSGLLHVICRHAARRYHNYNDWRNHPSNSVNNPRNEQQQIQDGSGGDDNNNDDNLDFSSLLVLLDDNRAERQLSLTYDSIYGQAETYIEADETRTWLWLIIALLINITCIHIELLIFQNLMDDGNKFPSSAASSSSLSSTNNNTTTPIT
jgi:hypothetical protein